MLAKVYRLRNSDDFDRVMNGGRKVVCPSFILYGYSDSKSKNDRVGLVVSKKVGKSVLRNRMKRVLRETFRNDVIRSEINFTTGRKTDVVIVVRPRAAKLHARQIRSDFINCLTRLAKEIRKDIDAKEGELRS